ncbi:MAG TPA: hypothetical protein VGL40_12360 [Bacillota bacterium]
MRPQKAVSDEVYVLKLIVELLGEECSWQQTFGTLRGEPGMFGVRRMLPVDGFFPRRNLVVEYHGAGEDASGAARDRIADWAREHELTLLDIDSEELSHEPDGRLKRHKDNDLGVLIRRLLDLDLLLK